LVKCYISKEPLMQANNSMQWYHCWDEWWNKNNVIRCHGFLLMINVAILMVLITGLFFWMNMSYRKESSLVNRVVPVVRNDNWKIIVNFGLSIVKWSLLLINPPYNYHYLYPKSYVTSTQITLEVYKIKIL